MKITGIPEFERRLIINLCWHQQATVRWDKEVGTTTSRRATVHRDTIQRARFIALLITAQPIHRDAPSPQSHSPRVGPPRQPFF